MWMFLLPVWFLYASVFSWRHFFRFHAFVFFFVCSPQGIKHSDHFGFICRDQIESGASQYVCFVFQCASESLVSHTVMNENNSILFFWAWRTFLCMFVCVRWTRWCWPWSRPSLQQQLYRATKQRSSCVKPAPCMTCTNSASGLKVILTLGDLSLVLFINILMQGVLQRENEFSYSLLCLQVSTHPEQS